MTEPAPPRILIAKAGLDGHDRGALLVCLALRDAGCEVLYTGIRNTPSQIVATAVQEDVDGVGLSSLSGAHKALFPRVAEGLRAAGATDIALFAGGIFPPSDKKLLHEAGIERLFDPGTPMSEITGYCKQKTEERRAKKSAASNGSARALAMRLSEVEISTNGAAHREQAAADPRIIGLTGPGGTGKSTLIDSLIAEIRRRGERVAVLCVDPSSVRSGGAFLGDRIRMQRHAGEEGVFVRSVATRGAGGGVPACVGAMARVLREAGYDWVLVETVGTGQNQTDVRRHVGRMLLVTAPGQGDAVQIFKSNALEIADIVAVTRSDQGRSEEYAKDIRAALRATRREEPVPVVVVSGERGLGVGDLVDQLKA